MPGITVLAMRAMALCGRNVRLAIRSIFSKRFRRQVGGLFFHAYEILILLIQSNQYPKSFASQ